MNTKLLGGILLVVGTSIGGGMLALPISTAQGGFLGALLLLFSSWLVMTLGAFLILEVNLWLPEESNLISMAKNTIGKAGELIAWVSYLLLLYSLLAAYTSGGGDVLNGLFNLINFHCPEKLDNILFLIVLGTIVYSGIHFTDYVNRTLLSIKLGAFIFLSLLIIPHLHYQSLETLNNQYVIPALTVVITSFGFATLVPSLRSYLNSDVKKLRFAILIGSLIPLICYIIWIGVILGDLPLKGDYGLIKMLTSSQPTSVLVQSIQISIHHHLVGPLAHLFTSVCVATSFLGVSLSLSDFLADGLKLKKYGLQKIFIFILTYLPPLLVALLYPRAFLMCLSYAGSLCVILLMILPALMAWRGRYVLGLSKENHYQVWGGKLILMLVLLAGFLVIFHEIYASIFK